MITFLYLLLPFNASVYCDDTFMTFVANVHVFTCFINHSQLVPPLPLIAESGAQIPGTNQYLLEVIVRKLINITYLSVKLIKTWGNRHDFRFNKNSSKVYEALIWQAWWAKVKLLPFLEETRTQLWDKTWGVVYLLNRRTKVMISLKVFVLSKDYTAQRIEKV